MITALMRASVLLSLCVVLAGCGGSKQSLVQEAPGHGWSEPAVVTSQATPDPVPAAPSAPATPIATPIEGSLSSVPIDKVLEGAFASIAKGNVVDVTTLSSGSTPATVANPPVAATTTVAAAPAAPPQTSAPVATTPATVPTATPEAPVAAAATDPVPPAVESPVAAPSAPAATPTPSASTEATLSEIEVAEAWQRAVGQPPNSAVVSQANPNDYRVQPEDMLDVTVYEEPDLTVQGARVTSAGEVMFPLLGRVTVAGLTVDQVQEKLIKMLGADYLVNPQVQVSIQAYHSGYIFVTGAVGKPGSYAIPTERRTTLMEAIAMAGGFSDRASSNSTRIVRVEDGQKKTITVRANDIVKRGDKDQDVVVYPNDIVFVPESFL